jgi:hypothetical protein
MDRPVLAQLLAQGLMDEYDEINPLKPSGYYMYRQV